MGHTTGGRAAPAEAASITSPEPRSFLEGPGQAAGTAAIHTAGVGRGDP